MLRRKMIVIFTFCIILVCGPNYRTNVQNLLYYNNRIN